MTNLIDKMPPKPKEVQPKMIGKFAWYNRQLLEEHKEVLKLRIEAGASQGVYSKPLEFEFHFISNRIQKLKEGQNV